MKIKTSDHIWYSSGLRSLLASVKVADVVVLIKRRATLDG